MLSNRRKCRRLSSLSKTTSARNTRVSQRDAAFQDASSRRAQGAARAQGVVRDLRNQMVVTQPGSVSAGGVEAEN
eukprot:2573502-Lingulodinium_polyedra.AAC.1